LTNTEVFDIIEKQNKEEVIHFSPCEHVL